MTRDLLKDGVSHSKKQIVNQILEFIETFNKYIAKPFLWSYAG